MSEQKYYLKINQDALVDSHLGRCSGYTWLDDESVFMQKKFRHAFTLYELEKSSQGIFARYCAFDDLTDINNLVRKNVDGYWINPLIELVLVDEV